MSLRAPFTDAATAIDPTNHSNIFTSYYPYGAIVALALDLAVRQRFPGRSLDDYMRRLWRTHGVTERPYTPNDLREALATVTGDRAFADLFFETSIEGSYLPDFDPLLRQAGLLLRRSHAGEPWAGPVGFTVEEESVSLDSNSAVGTPLYAAGLDRGDEIVRLGRDEIDSEADWQESLARHAPGDEVEIMFVQRGRERTATLVLAEDPTLEVVRFETANLRPTPAQLAFRQAWLGAEADESASDSPAVGASR